MYEFGNYISRFIIQWTGIPIFRLAIMGVACLLLTVTAVAIWRKRIRVLSAFLCLISGFLLLTIAIYPGILKLFIQIEYINRVRIAIGFLSMVVLGITFESLRMTKMQERYALLWVTTGLIILVFALLPQIVYMIGKITGMDYVNAIVAVIITFLLLVAFHFSVTMSQFQSHQSALAQQHAVLKSRVEVLEQKLGILPPANFLKSKMVKDTEDTEEKPDTCYLLSDERKSRAIKRASFLLIAIAVIGVLGIGLATPNPMIGDEVTHFYMLKTQSERLPVPNITARIPQGTGSVEIRRYPHVFLWHYLGAVFTKVMPLTEPRAVQLYHSLFLIQLLIFGYLTTRLRSDKGAISPFVYLLSLTSIPMLLIFSVAFYQDIPLTAQIVTACFFFQRKKPLVATLFICFSLTLKVTAVLFLPGALLILLILNYRKKSWLHFCGSTMVAIVLIGLTMMIMDGSLKRYGNASYYPLEKAAKMAAKMGFLGKPGRSVASPEVAPEPPKSRAKRVQTHDIAIIANHPGDLRNPENFFIYGGGLIWLLLLGFVVTPPLRAVLQLKNIQILDGCTSSASAWWIWMWGGSYLLFSYFFLKTAPDARFFLPGLILILMPVSESLSRLQYKKIWLPILIVIALLQSGVVLNKVFSLRSIQPATYETIEFLKKDRIAKRLFMYPEGNYRLFPLPHHWYLSYQLREFWRGDTKLRVELLEDHGLNTIVIKKHLIAPVSEEIINLGVYPTYFVRQIASDPRFAKVFENEGYIIYRVPSLQSLKTE